MSVKIEDATSAQSAARRHLEGQYGTDKIRGLSFSRTWLSVGPTREVWEVEGDVEVKKGMFGKEHRHFKYQIDPDTGRVSDLKDNTVTVKIN